MIRIELVIALLTITLGVTPDASAQEGAADDYISIRQEAPGVLSYGYYWAERLDGSQLAVVLRRSDNEMARRYAERSQRAGRLSTRLLAVWLTLTPVSLYTATRNINVGGPIALAALTAYGGAVFVERDDRTSWQLHQAVELYNFGLKVHQTAYYNPPHHDRERPVTLADTVSVGGNGWQRRFTYRGVPVMPGVQFETLLTHFDDKPLRTYQRQSNVLQRVKAVSGLAIVGLAAQLMLHSVRYYQTNGAARFNRPLAVGLSVGIVLGGVMRWPANRAQVRSIVRLNQLIRSEALQGPAPADKPAETP